MGTDEIAYQNKDITNKALTEQMLAVERTFFFKLGGKGIFQRLERKVGQNECLDDWELMEFIMIFLSCRAKVEGEKKCKVYLLITQGVGSSELSKKTRN